METLTARQEFIQNQYAGLKDDLRKKGVPITPLQKKEIVRDWGSLSAFRKKLFGKIKLYESERGWDEDWEGLQGDYPGVFNFDYPDDGLGRALLDIADQLYPKQALEQAERELLNEEARLELMQDEIKELEKRDKAATAEERAARDVEFDREEAEDLPFALKRQGKKGQHVELADGVQYSLKSFREQIQELVDGKFPRNDHLYVMDTPEVLQKLGLKQLPMLMVQAHVLSSMQRSGDDPAAHYHGLGLETMAQLPSAIADPAMVIKSHNYADRITVITQLTDSNGDVVIAAVAVNGDGTWQNVRIDSNTIASVYGKENIRGTIRRAIVNDEVMYINKNKSAQLAQSVGVQFPKSLSNGNSYVHTVSDYAGFVKNQNTQESAENARKSTESERKYALKKNGDAGQGKGRRFALKTESENSVDVEQALRAGDHSLSEQTTNATQNAATGTTQNTTRNTTNTTRSATNTTRNTANAAESTANATESTTENERITLVGEERQWANRLARHAVNECRSSINVADVRQDIARLYSELSDHGASSEALNATVNMARGIIEQSRRGDNRLREQYADLRRTMHNTKITLSALQREEAEHLTGSYGRYRRSLGGCVQLVESEDGTPLDTMWETWSASNPELFTPGLGKREQVQRLAEIKTMFEPNYQMGYGENLDAAATDLGMRIYADVLEHMGENGQAQTMRTMVQDMRTRYRQFTNAALQRVRQEQIARFQQVANDLHAAREAGDRARQDEIMREYRANVRRAGFQEAEAEARSAYRAQFEDASAWRKAHERTIKYARNLRQELECVSKIP